MKENYFGMRTHEKVKNSDGIWNYQRQHEVIRALTLRQVVGSQKCRLLCPII